MIWNWQCTSHSYLALTSKRVGSAITQLTGTFVSAYLSSQQGLITRLAWAEKVVFNQLHRVASPSGLDEGVIDSHLVSLLRIVRLSFGF